MSLSAPGLWLLSFIVPLVVVVIVGKVRLRRKAAELERNGGVEPAFAPADAPPPSLVLQRFSLPARAYLLRYKSVKMLIICAYAFFVMLSGGMLPASIQKFGLAGGGPRAIWHSYLFGITTSTAICSLFALGFGFLASVEISMSNFVRTRPISRSLIYWGRIGPILFTLFGAFALAVGLSLAILVLCYGPVYRHLLDGPWPSHVFLGHGAAKDLALTLRTSAPRLFLAIATMLMLGFSMTVAVLALPFRMARHKTAAAFLFWGGVLGYQAVVIGSNLVSPRLAQVFFLYSHLGPPPPYVYALVPVTLSAVLLLIASFLSNRLET